MDSPDLPRLRPPVPNRRCGGVRDLDEWYSLLADVRLAAICPSAVLVSGPRDRALKVAGRIVQHDPRCDGAQIVVCDAGDGQPWTAFEHALSLGASVLVVCEVHALSLTAQTMLLDLERARIEDRAGGIRRIIATTSASLPDAVRNGAFDSRLFHRLNMIRVEIPTLP
jgi:hypothetical protein